MHRYMNMYMSYYKATVMYMYTVYVHVCICGKEEQYMGTHKVVQ